MRNLILLTILFVSCSGVSHLKKKGYSDKDVADIEEHYTQYNYRMSVLTQYANTPGLVNAGQGMNKLYCKCFKKLGSKCSEPSRGIASQDRELWAKANAANIVLTTYSNPMMGGAVNKPDPMLCD